MNNINNIHASFLRYVLPFTMLNTHHIDRFFSISKHYHSAFYIICFVFHVDEHRNANKLIQKINLKKIGGRAFLCRMKKRDNILYFCRSNVPYFFAQITCFGLPWYIFCSFIYHLTHIYGSLHAFRRTITFNCQSESVINIESEAKY